MSAVLFSHWQQPLGALDYVFWSECCAQSCWLGYSSVLWDQRCSKHRWTFCAHSVLICSGVHGWSSGYCVCSGVCGWLAGYYVCSRAMAGHLVTKCVVGYVAGHPVMCVVGCVACHLVSVCSAVCGWLAGY